MILFAAAAMTELRRRAQADPRSRLRLLGGLVAACVLCWWPMDRPDDAVLERNLAYAYEQDRRFPEAIAIYERLRQHESNAENDLYLANALGLAGRGDEARELLRSLTASGQPLWVRQRAWAFTGDLARRTKQWEEAEAAYRAALALDATEYGSWNNLGIVLVNRERFREAEEAFRRAIALAPEDDLAVRNLESLRQFLRSSDR